MTHTSTEQERAQFEAAFIEQKLMERGISGDVAEKDLREVFLWKDAAGCYDHKETKAALWGWQAARSAPVVQHGWVLVPDADNMTDEQAEAICNLVSCCGGGAHEVYEAALTAAPQPPEASSLKSENRTTKPDAAPVQLPDNAVNEVMRLADAYSDACETFGDYQVDSNAKECVKARSALEQQVRQLLAAQARKPLTIDGNDIIRLAAEVGLCVHQTDGWPNHQKIEQVRQVILRATA